MSGRMTPQRRAALAGAAQEADALRQDWREGVQHHQLRLEAQFKELSRRLKAKAKGRQPKGLPSGKEAEHIRALMAHVRIKSGKGRAKDLRRVEEALRQALDRLPLD